MNSTKIPFWKYWLSYLFEIHLESEPSEINPHLYVSLVNGKLQLSTENAIYSYEDRYDNFREAFQLLNIDSENFKNVLVLGLGLGSVPLMLEQFDLNAEHMTIVEIDESVIYLAEKYIMKRINTPYSTHCIDAEYFVQSTSEKYDLIISDIFIDVDIPSYFTSSAYLLKLEEISNQNALILYNCLASKDSDKKNSMGFYDNTFSKIFKKSKLLKVWANYVLLSNKTYLKENDV